MGNELTADFNNGTQPNTRLEKSNLSPREQPTSELPPITTESLVPRLGDSLLDAGTITADQLQRALAYQREQAANGKLRLLGQALTDLGFLDQETLDRAIARQLVSFQDALKDSNRLLELRVRQRTEELERLIVEIRTAAEITQIAISAKNLDELLHRTVNLIADRFKYSQATVYLIDPEQACAVFSEASGDMGKSLKGTGYKIPIGASSLVGWVATHNQPRVDVNVGEDPLYQKEGIPSNMGEGFAKAEAAIPLSVNDIQGNPQVIGVLDIKHTELEAFDSDTMAILQTIANHIAATISNLRLLKDTQSRLHEISSLYQASQKIAQATKVADVIDIASNALKEASQFSAVLLPAALPDGKHMIVYQIQNRYDSSEVEDTSEKEKNQEYSPANTKEEPDQEERTDGEGFALVWPIISTAELMDHLKLDEHKLIDLEESDLLPHALLAIPRHFGCTVAAIIPVIANNKLEAIFMIGSRQRNTLTTESIQPYASLSQQTTTALEKVYALANVEKRLDALQTLNTLSQAVSVETDLKSLYRSVHNEINHIMGEVNFIIALYEKETNLINIPYLYEEHTIKSVEPFPLGEGLTSILIRTRQPLLIAEDADKRARELGAIVLGAPAKSWLGVPLLIGGEAIGAMIIQDLENELRFDEDDLRLMSSLALQVAAGLRNARLLDNTYRQAERERLLHEISRKIRGSTDLQTIMKVTSQELGKYTGAQRVRIELGNIIGGTTGEASSPAKQVRPSNDNQNDTIKPTAPPFSSTQDSV